MHWVLYRLQNTGSTSVALDCIENNGQSPFRPPHSLSTPANLVAKLDYFWKGLNHMARVTIGRLPESGSSRLTESPWAAPAIAVVPRVFVVLAVIGPTQITTLIMITRAP